jgi:L-fuconolactonase
MRVRADRNTSDRHVPSLIDSHFHVWNKAAFSYGWLEAVPQLNCDHLLPLYRANTRDLGIQKAVFVEAYVDQRHSMDEALWALSLANKNPLIACVVGAVYLERLEGHEQLRQLATWQKFKGVRRLLDEESSDGFPATEDFIKGVQLLEEYGLPFDICIRRTQMDAAIELVDRSPGVRFVLDHGGKPNIRDQEWQPWAGQIAALSAHKNVYCKLSGLMSEAGIENTSVECLGPYVNHLISNFGFERIMFGTDWPVCNLVASPARWMQILVQSIGDINPRDYDWLFSRTCERFYAL